MRVIFKVLLTVILMVSQALVMADTGEPQVWFSADNLRPGDFLQIKVKTAGDAVVRVRFQESTRELWKTENNEFIGFLPVSYYNTPGEYQISVLVKTGSLNWVKPYPIRISERKFPESRITVPETTRKEILSDTNTKSDAKITTETRLEAVQTGILPLWEGPFIWPIKGRISTGFGRIRYVNNIDNGRHSGLDIVSPAGTPVLAANRGQIVFAGNLYVTGLTVMVYHGLNLFTSYCHLSAITVKEGDLIQKGAVLGKVGSTGLSTGPHLHLTFRIDEVSVDPELFLEKTIGWEFTSEKGKE